MTHHYDFLACPQVERMSPPERRHRAAEDQRIAIAARERASVLFAAADGRAALAIQELNGLAELLLASATVYDPGRKPPP